MRKVTLLFMILIVCGAILLAGCTQQPPGPPQTTTPAPTPVPDTVRVASNPQYGTILVDSGGKTLYYFTKDTPGNGTSACYNQWVVIWPVFRAEPLRVSPPLSAVDFGEITRTTGEKQTTFRGWPLYYYQGDVAPGETQAMPNTPLMTGGVIRAFGNVSDSVIELWVKKVKEAGAPRIRVNDPMHDMNQILKLIKWCKTAVAISMPALIFSISPYHTDKYYAGLAKEMAKAGCDRMFIKDVDGLLTPERVRTLVPTILKIIDGMPLEWHSHCTTGLAPICYLEAIKLGVKTLHTAVRPVANGTSQPSIQNILSNSRPFFR